MNKVYKIVWHALKRQWVVVSELARRGKTKSTKLLAAAVLVSISANAFAGSACQVSDASKIKISGGSACELNDASYIGKKVHGSDNTVITVNNGGEVTFSPGSGKVTIESEGQNHGLVIGTPEPYPVKGQTGAGTIPNPGSGGEVTVNGNLDVKVDAHAVTQPDTSKTNYRPSSILIGDNSRLVVKGDLTIDHKDYLTNIGYETGAPLDISLHQARSAGVEVKGETKITSTGDGIRNGSDDNDKQYGGALHFYKDATIQSEFVGLKNNGGSIYFDKNLDITSNQGKAIIQTSGLLYVKGDVNLTSSKNGGVHNSMDIYGGDVQFHGKTTIDSYGDGDNEYASSTSIYIKDNSKSGTVISFTRELNATTYGSDRNGVKKGTGDVIKMHSGLLYLAPKTTLTAKGTGNGISQTGGVTQLSSLGDSTTIINTRDGDGINIKGGLFLSNLSKQLTITTTKGGHAINMQGGEMSLAKNTVLTAKESGHGIKLSDGIINLTDKTTINTEHGDGISISGNGTLDGSNSNQLTINTTKGGHAINVDGGRIFLAKDTALTANESGNGINISLGHIKLNDKTTINTEQGHGISISSGFLDGSGSNQLIINTTKGGNAINVDGGRISLAKDTALTANGSGDGIKLSYGLIDLNDNTTINTEHGDAILIDEGIISGGTAFGVTAKNLTATTSGKGNVVTLHGGEFRSAENTELTAEDSGHGINMSGGLVILGKSTNINVKSGDGLHVDGGDMITTDDSVLNIHAQEAKAIQINNGSLTLRDINISKDNAGSAIELAGGEFSNLGKISFLNAQDVAAIHGTATAGKVATFNNNGSIDISKVTDMVDIIHHDGTGTLVVNNTQDGQLSSQSGHVLTNTATGTIEAHNHGVLTGKIDSGDGKISLNNTGLWESTGQSTLTGIHNAGTILFKHPNASGDFFTINVKGDYNGDNGFVEMHTVWNAPNNSQSDTLNIDGKATGSTTIIPVSADGTRNFIDGNVKRVNKVINTIPVVKVAQSSADVAFTGTAQTTGVSEVQLKKRTTDEGKDEYYWSITADTTGPDKPVKPENTKLIYADAVAGYTLMPRVNLEQGFASMGSLRERRGAILANENSDTSWARTFGKHQKQDGKTRLNLDTDIYGLQIGQDFWYKQTGNNGSNVLGSYVSYSRANTDFADKYHARNGLIIADKKTGEGKSDNFSFGVTNTYYSGNGTYVDLVGQLSYLRNKYSARTGQNPGSQDGWGFAMSAEVGRSIPLSNSNWSIEPQAQLMYQYLDLDTMNDGVRNIDQNNQDALRGRVGLAVSYQAGDKTEPGTSFYSVGNIWHDFTNPSSVTIGRDSIREKTNNTWGEVGVGVKIPVAKQSNIYADVRYEHNFGSSKRQSFRGNIGLNINW